MTITRKFKIKTETFRKNIVYIVAKTITPVFYREIKVNSTFTQKVPRPFTLTLQKHFNNKPIKGCEIGFGLGQNCLNLLNILNIEQLYSIDPLIGKPYMDLKGEVFSHVNKPNLYKYIKKTFSNVKFLEFTSDEAIKHIPINSLDFVYIDGLHTYNQCLKDLINYYPLIKQGGFIGGHDFTRACEEGVIKAVLNFSQQIHQAPTIKIPDYWFTKK